MFHCRNKELSELDKRYNQDEFECIVIYGRRRVGKTSLITEFCKEKPTIFFSALNATMQENLEALSKAIYEKDHLTSDEAPIYPSFDAALSDIARMASKERLVFVIDEYPYLAKSDESISSRLQHIIDHTLKDGKLFLILCGSSMSFMEHQVLGYESPLYGRRTGQLKIESLTYKEVTEFNPELTLDTQALIYGITGGIPHYINKLGVKADLDEALKENLFNTASYLFEEPGNLLKQELREPAIYNSVIAAVAGGASHANEIATKVGISPQICAKYLKALLELGILVKETPITEKEGRKSIYAVGDNFFRFWYRFVPQNLSAISAGKIERIYEPVIKNHFSEYMGLVFEKICRDYLFLYADDTPGILTDIGQWWGTDANRKQEVQIDIVGALTQPGEYIIGSCKYRNSLIGVDELELLRNYAQVFGKGRKYHYYIFSKGGFTKGLEELAERGEVRIVTLDEMYG